MLGTMSTKLRLTSLGDLGTVLPHAPATAPGARPTLPLVKPRTVLDPNGKPVVVRSARRVAMPDHVARGRDPGVYGAPIKPKVDSSIKTQPAPRDFRAALADPFYPGISPSRLPVPAELLTAFTNAKRILLVGHVYPDHDTVGAVLALRAALRALGKEVDVCIDGDLTTTQRRLAGDIIKRPEDLRGGSWDLAVVCDTSGAHRIGKAIDLVDSAAQQVVVDHHPQERERNDCLIERYGCDDASWLEDEHRRPYDAASLQACAIADKLLAGRRLDAKTIRSVYLPALIGMVTDTKWGTLSSMSPLTPHVFKHAMRAADLRMEHIEELLKTPSNQVTSAIADARFIERVPVGRGKSAAMILKVKGEHWQHLLRIGAAAKTPLNESEVLSALKSAAAQYVNDLGIAILAIEKPGSVMLSIQSTGGRAQSLAALIGQSNGGHPNIASTTVHGGSLESTVERLLFAAYGARILA